MTAVPETVQDHDTPDAGASYAARHRRALGALRAVETRTGARAHDPAARQAGPGGVVRPVGPAVAGLLPDGGLAAGTTVVVAGSTTLLLALLAAPSRAGAWTVLVGHPEVGLAAAADAGCELARVVCVPDPGPDAPAVVAALLDGMDLVVVGPRTVLLDQDRRRLTARARERGTVLLVAQPSPVHDVPARGTTPVAPPSQVVLPGALPPNAAWPGAAVVLTAASGAWDGADHGAGHLRRRSLTIRRTGRGWAARPATLRCLLPEGAAPAADGPPRRSPAERGLSERGLPGQGAAGQRAAGRGVAAGAGFR